MKKLWMFLLLITVLPSCSEQGLSNYCSAIHSSGGGICYEWGQQQIVQQQQGFKDKIDSIDRNCKDKRKKGIYKTESKAMRECEKPQIMKVLRETNTPNIDIIDAIFTRGIVLTEKVEKGQITQAQADDQLSQYTLELSNIKNQREQQQASQILELMAIEASRTPSPSIIYQTPIVLQTPAPNKIHCSTTAHPAFGSIKGSLETDCQ